MSDDEINVEEIMHTIRENVRKRKQSEKNLKVPDNQVGRLPLTPGTRWIRWSLVKVI